MTARIKVSIASTGNTGLHWIQICKGIELTKCGWRDFFYKHKVQSVKPLVITYSILWKIFCDNPSSMMEKTPLLWVDTSCCDYIDLCSYNYMYVA